MKKTSERKIVKVSRCFGSRVRSVSIVARPTLSKRALIRRDKAERDEEKRIEMEKYQDSIKLEKQRNLLCEKLLRKIQAREQNFELDSNPTIPYSELGKTWIFTFDENGKRNLVRKKETMNFTGDELLAASSRAIEEILSIPDGETLNVTKIHQMFAQEVANLSPDEIRRNIELCSVLSKFFNTQKIALAGAQDENERIQTAIRKNKLTLNVPAEKKSAIMAATEKLDKKFGRQIAAGLAGKEVSKENKWKADKLKTSYADLVDLDFDRIEDLTKNESNG